MAAKITLCILVTALLTVCAFTGRTQEPKHISGSQFQHEYEIRNQQTMHVAEYLGEKDGNVYLLKKSLSVLNRKQWHEQMLYTGVSELDPKLWVELQDQMREY